MQEHYPSILALLPQMREAGVVDEIAQVVPCVFRDTEVDILGVEVSTIYDLEIFI